MLRGFKYIVLLAVTVVFLTGCGQEKKEEEYVQETVEEAFQGMCGTEANICYEPVTQKPNISVNMIGYESDEKKMAIFKTEGLARYFYLLDVDTNETVYRGMIEEPVYNVLMNAYISTGDFSSVTKEGKYIVYTDFIGESYPFEIRNKVKSTLFTTGLQEFCMKTDEYMNKPYVKNSFFKKAEMLNYMLLSYSLYPKSYADGVVTDSANEIPDILDETKKVIEWCREIQTSGMSANDRMAFIGLLAKFSQVYKPYDNAYANTCRKDAEEFYKEAVKSGAEKADTQIAYYASSVLYHLTGYVKYRSALYEVMDSEKYTHDNWDYAFLAEMNYLIGKKNVDIERCNVIMRNLMAYAEEITSTSGNDALGIASYKPESILRKMRYLVIANYVLESNEYREILRNHYTYLAGVNVAGENSLKALQEKDKVLFLFMLADMNENI